MNYRENDCEAQAFLFKTVDYRGYDVEKFARDFLTSEFCAKDVDSYLGRFHQELFLDVIIEITGIQLEQADERNPYAGDIGYLYRMVANMLDMPSKELYSLIPYDEMEKYAYKSDFYFYEEIANMILSKLRE